MTQKYCTEHLLPHYIKSLNAARMVDPRCWWLQEDNDPSHSTKSSDNMATNLKDISWLPRISHPPQSPDLNPVEGMWLILKQRIKRWIWWPREGQERWDGTESMLKKMLLQVWDEISMIEVQNLIKEMPYRCSRLAENGAEKQRSAGW